MSLYDFFFPHQAQATHLRDLASAQKRQARAAAATSMSADELHARVRNLENDLGYTALILGSILDQLDRKGVVTRADVTDAMAAVDELDGVRDGQLDINILRGRHG